jgi:hypothetical protein
MYVCIYIYIYIHTHTHKKHTHTHKHTHTYTNTHIYIKCTHTVNHSEESIAVICCRGLHDTACEFDNIIVAEVLVVIIIPSWNVCMEVCVYVCMHACV